MDEAQKAKAKKTKDSRYKSLLERSFNQLLRYKIYDDIEKKGQPRINIENMVIDQTLKNDFSVLYQNMGEVRRLNQKLSEYKSRSKGKAEIKEYKHRYKEYFKKEILSYEAFGEFWDKEDRKCIYCGVTEEEIISLIGIKAIKTKRLYSRGETMEVDREEPDGEYTKDNIVLACYWCNNAKTDEFTKAEFKNIGIAIGRVWKHRLKK